MLKHIDKTTLCFINKDCVERKEFYFDLNVKLNLSSLSLRWALVLWPGTFDNKPLHIFNRIFVGIQENLIFYSKTPVTDSVRSIVHFSGSSLVWYDLLVSHNHGLGAPSRFIRGIWEICLLFVGPMRKYEAEAFWSLERAGAEWTTHLLLSSHGVFLSSVAEFSTTTKNNKK